MRITGIEIENFRSVRSLSLGDIGPREVLYGRNGSGKSNVLRAISRAFSLLGAWLVGVSEGRSTADGSVLVGAVASDDFRIGTETMRLGLSLDLRPAELVAEGAPAVRSVRFELDVRGPASKAMVRLTRLDATVDAVVDAADLLAVVRGVGVPHAWPGFDPSSSSHTDRARREGDLARAFQLALIKLCASYTHVEDVRAFSHVRDATEAEPETDPRHLLRMGRTEEALARAATSDDDDLRQGFNRVRAVVTAEPLGLPDFEAVVPGGVYKLRLRASGKKAGTVPATAASLGNQQVLIIIGSVLLGGGRIIALEEPEAHLHAPTTGRALRAVLDRMVDQDIDQLFIATHSNLFDLDPRGFLSVVMIDGETTVRRERDLSAIDRDHLFEPGPAKRVLQDVLRFEAPDTVVGTGEGGQPITAAALLASLQSDTEEGVSFARRLSEATVRLVIARRGAGA